MVVRSGDVIITAIFLLYFHDCFQLFLGEVQGEDPAHPRQVHQGEGRVRITLIHCNENCIFVCPFWELRGLSPNFHIHVSVSDLYIFPGSVHKFPAAE